MPHQQNLEGRQIGVVVLKANAWQRVRVRTKEINEAIELVQPGEAIEVPIPY